MNMHEQVIIVFGISGVGKTTICKQFVESHSRYIHVSASQLLKDTTGSSSEGLRMSDEATIRSNQTLIGVALKQRRLENLGRSLLIDAHSVIDNDRTLVPVPTETIESMCPTALLFLEQDPHVLLERRAKDTRLRPPRSISELKDQQRLATEIAIGYSRSLSLPLAIGVVHTLIDFENLIQSCQIDLTN